AQIQVRPTSGPARTQIDVRARGLPTPNPFERCARVVDFEDSSGAVFGLTGAPWTSSFRVSTTIPVTASPGQGSVYVQDKYPGPRFHSCSFEYVLVIEASAPFDVT